VKLNEGAPLVPLAGPALWLGWAGVGVEGPCWPKLKIGCELAAGVEELPPKIGAEDCPLDVANGFDCPLPPALKENPPPPPPPLPLPDDGPVPKTNWPVLEPPPKLKSGLLCAACVLDAPKLKSAGWPLSDPTAGVVLGLAPKLKDGVDGGFVSVDAGGKDEPNVKLVVVDAGLLLKMLAPFAGLAFLSASTGWLVPNDKDVLGALPFSEVAPNMFEAMGVAGFEVAASELFPKRPGTLETVDADVSEVDLFPKRDDAAPSALDVPASAPLASLPSDPLG
jgi:hypothetical protein